MNWNHLTGRGKALAAVSAIALLSAMHGCAALRSSPTVSTMLTGARAAALGILELINFIEEENGSEELAEAARDALREKDYGAALAASYMAVEEMRARGVGIPLEIDRALYMVRGAMAAQAFDDLAKAMRQSLDE